MSTKNGKSFSDTKNLNLRGGVTGTGLLRWNPPVTGTSGSNWASNPFGTDDYGLYINSSDKLVFSALGSTTVLGSGGGGGGTPSWDDIFAADKTFNPNGTTWTIADGSAGVNDILTITNAGTGSAIQITNTSTGKDINGTGSTWSVTAAGVGAFTNVTSPIVYSAANLILSCAGGGVITLGANANTITMAKATTFSSTVTVTDGQVTLNSTSNVAPAVIVTNNTVTTYGSGGADAGVFVIRSTSLTTGDLLKLQTDASLTSGQGNYISCYDTGLSAEVFTISELGLTTIAGAAYGTAAVVMTLGDLSLADGRITHVAPSLTTGYGYSLTTTGLTTGTGMLLSHTTSVIASGGSLLRLQSTGTNTGTTTGVLLDLADASVAGTKILGTFGTTTGIGMSLVTAVTSGTALSLTNGTGIIVTTGEMLLVAANSATTCTGLVRVSGTGLTDGFAMELTGGGANATASGGVVNILAGAATAGTALKVSTTGVYAGTTGVLSVSATSATTGYIAVIDGSGLTTGTALLIKATEATLQATGYYVRFYDGAANDFSVGKYGATVIAGNAATDVFTITAGHAVLTSGNLTLTSGNAVLTAGNLTLTLGNAVLTSGNLTLTSGNALLTAGNLTLTDGDITLTDGFIKGTPQAIVNANTAIDVTHLVTTIANNAPSTHTLADGAVGQIKIINCVTYTGDAVITPTNFVGTTITLNAAGDSWTGIFLGTEWQTLALSGTAAIA